MANATQRRKERKDAKNILTDINDNLSEYLIIHYSCESFFNLPQGNTPRITSIAVRFVKNAQTKSFSIHKVAELNGVKPSEIDQNYNDLEKEMLDEYFTFVARHTEYKWIHINMRNINFGFEAIKHRYKVLGGNPCTISDSFKIDLARLFVRMYGREYSPHPRMESLYRLNKITMSSFLSGKEEAEAFNNGDYVALHQSTLRKVDNMHNVLSLAINDDLKTKSNILKIYGISPSGIFYAAKESWIIAMVLFLLTILTTSLIGLGINNFFEVENDNTDQIKVETELIKLDSQ